MARSRKEPGAALVAASSENRGRLAQLAAIGEQFTAAGWRPAAEVLVPVRAVQTVFPQYDAITRVAGHPTDRITLVHGESGHGKTEFAHGLGLSFLQKSHLYGFIDAEYTTPSTWLQQLMRSFHSHPGFRALRPKTYEETVEMVERFATMVGEAKAKGALEPDTTALLVVDSLRKLVPRRLLETMMKEDADATTTTGAGGRKKKPGGVDGMAGRGAMFKAALNAAWMDRLVPLMAHTGCAMVLIAREYEDPDAGVFQVKDYKVGGGRSPYYDSSLVIRIVRDGWVKDGTGADAAIYGERVRVEIHKTKVGQKEERIPEAFFHTSNGTLGPVGFDLPRDLLELALARGLVQKSGSHYSFERKRLGQGEHAVVKKLHEDQGLLDHLHAAVRAEIAAGLNADEAGRNTPSASAAAP